MEEINLKDLLAYYVKKIPIILLIAIITMVLGMLYNILFKKPLYYGDVTLILVQENNYNQNSSITQNDILLNQKLVSTYTEIIKSKRVLDRAIKELGLDYSYENLKNNIKISSINNTEIIKIAVSDRSNSDAATIANKIADVFQEEVTEIYNLENVSIIDVAMEQEQPYNIHSMRDAIIYLAVGLVLSTGIFFVIYYFDTSIKSSEEVEQRLGIPVIGTIPLSRKGKK